MKSARKAAAPKDKVYDGTESESDDSDEEAAGPSAVAVEVPPAPIESKDGLTEKEEIAKRHAEKRAKRDARKDERKAKRKAERVAKRAAEKGEEKGEDEGEDKGEDEGDDSRDEEDAPMANGDAEKESDDGDEEVDDETIPDLPDRHARSPSPPPLEPFPLPRMAPAPDAAVLSRQGMPTGLEDAEFVDQSLRMKIEDLPTALSERTQTRLADVGVDNLFAVQAAILPHILSLPLVPLPYTPLHDYLISAPTGSGKTLAYAIPIVELLAKRIVPRLRALIVLPTRDLVVQVRETLETLAKGSGLTVGLDSSR